MMRLKYEAPNLVLEVTDQGIGISPERQKDIFKPFEQADNTITRKFGGTGLGLAITQKLVAMLEGEITLKSAPGQGSTFRVTLPYPKRGARRRGWYAKIHLKIMRILFLKMPLFLW